MSLLPCISILLVLFDVGRCQGERPVVSIEDGLIQGLFKESFEGRRYMAFEGIPYAKPPILTLRFKEPEPADPWPGVLDATTTYTCIQLGLTGEIIGQEDCLYANVYVPREKIDPEEKLDVIVHIHGGAFMLGSPTMLSGPVYLMDRDVVYVNFNYRLGPFGFISAADKTLRGNYGLKDQQLLLEWVQKNIGSFGGNNNSVTIIGTSAGGASVHLHYFSPKSRNLFHRGFAHSGSALNPWSIKTDLWQSTKTLAEELGCYFESNTNAIYKCLKQRSALQIVNGVKKLYKAPLIPLVPFSPTTETFLPMAFINAMPYLQVASKVVYDVPLLISMTTEEGTVPAALFYDKIDELNANWTYWLPLMLEYYDHSEEKRDEISAKIKEFYFKDEPLTKENFPSLVKLCTHRLFHIGAEKVARLQANASESDVYFLMMGYSGEKYETPNYLGSAPDLGVGHGYDIKFYYDTISMGMDLLKDEREIKMKDILIDMLVSFAKTGKPQVGDAEFLPVSKTEGNLKYLSIKGPDNIAMKSIKWLGAPEFWKSLELKEDENVFRIGDKHIEIR